MAILRVEGPNGELLYSFSPRETVVLSDVTSYIMTDMLRGVIERGTGRRANIGRPAAGKTGTTDRERDLWFVGYTPDLVAAVWIGDDQNRPLQLSGATVGSGEAGAIWGSFMRAAHAGLPIRDFPKPATGLVEDVLIDVQTGLLADASCFMIPQSDLRREIFAAGTEPTERSPRCDNPFWSPLSGSEPQDEDGRNGLNVAPDAALRLDFDFH